MIVNPVALRSYHKELCTHSHDFAQLVLPLVGSMELEAGGYSGIIDNTKGVFIAPNELHCFAGSQNNLFLVIDITPQNYFASDYSTSHSFNVTRSLKKLIQFTHHYLIENAGDLFTDSLVNQLLFHFTNKLLHPECDPIVLKAKTWMDSHCFEPIDVKKLAQHTYRSLSQLQRRFKRVMGCSLAEYWRLNKLHQAKKMLTLKNCSIEAIAYAIGYENVSAFSRRFTQAFGQSPSQWRKSLLISTPKS